MRKFLLSALVAGALALSAFSFSLPARSADVGGSCCSDLEERIAELEATSAKKGTRKTSLEVYGQVSTSILYSDVKITGSGATTNVLVGDNKINNPSLFGFRGFGKVNGDWNAGYAIELGLQPATEGAADTISVRKANWWIENGKIGKVTIGRLSAATDGIDQISLASTYNVAVETTMGVSRRYNGVRYDTPSLGGLTFAASTASDQGVDGSDIAARYVGEGMGLRFAAGIGYNRKLNAPIDATSDQYTRTLLGSASLMHVGTGLFANVSAGERWIGTTLTTANIKETRPAYQVQAGIQTGVFPNVGATTIFGEYAHAPAGSTMFSDWAGLDNKVGWYGFGINQAIDAAALDLFAGIRNVEDTSSNRSTQVMAGARIKF